MVTVVGATRVHLSQFLVAIEPYGLAAINSRTKVLADGTDHSARCLVAINSRKTFCKEYLSAL
jgi:hypothetical protein